MDQDNGEDEASEDVDRCQTQRHGDIQLDRRNKEDVGTKRKIQKMIKHTKISEKEKTSRHDIFCDDIVRNSSFAPVNLKQEIKGDKTGLQRNFPKGRKKKNNHLRSLKKTSGQVAALPPIKKMGATILPLIIDVLQPSNNILPDIFLEGHTVLQENIGDEILLEAGGKRKGSVEETLKHETVIDKATDDVLKPFKICTFIVRFPLLSFLVTLSAQVIALLITITLLATGSDVFPLVFDDLPLIIMNDARLRDLAWRARLSYPDFVFRPVYDSQIPTWWRGQVKDIVEVIYEAPRTNVFTYKQLKLMEAAEKSLFELPDYQKLFCRLEKDASCTKPQSLLRLFDGTFQKINPVFYSPNFSDIHNVVYLASIYNETTNYLNLFVGKDFKVTRNFSTTSITRSFFLMGWPLYTYGPYQGTLTDLEHFLIKQFKPAVEWVRNNLMHGSSYVYYISKMMLELDLKQQAIQDMMLSIGSFVFICIFMCIQMASLTIPLLGITSILSSFLMTNLIYRYVFQYRYFGLFHVIIIFLILGIGADDLFVFYDTWRLTGHSEYPSDAHRLSDCYRRAAKTTFVTSVTTMAAFLINGFSPLMPVSTCGIFAGILVAINYISVITYFPAVIILHHTKIKGRWYKCHSDLVKIWKRGIAVEKNHKAHANENKNKKPSLANINQTDVPLKNKTDQYLPSGAINSGFSGKIGIGHQHVSDDINIGVSCENIHNKDVENENGSRMYSCYPAMESNGVHRDDSNTKDHQSVSGKIVEDDVDTVCSKTAEKDTCAKKGLHLYDTKCCPGKMGIDSRLYYNSIDSDENVCVPKAQSTIAKGDTEESCFSLTADTNMSKLSNTEDFNAYRNNQRCHNSAKTITRGNHGGDDLDLGFKCATILAHSQSEISLKNIKNFRDRNKVVLFLMNTFYHIITKRSVKIGILLMILGLSMFFVKSATTLEPDTYQLGIFRDNHNYAIAAEKHYFSFLRNSDDEESKVYLVWGMKPVDISSCDAKSAEYCRGTPLWDENFDMRLASAQLAFKGEPQFCSKHIPNRGRGIKKKIFLCALRECSHEYFSAQGEPQFCSKHIPNREMGGKKKYFYVAAAKNVFMNIFPIPAQNR
ncbi:hypothetical protein ACJMK2_036207 [Sinanodonta woodiana]|uniref:SSD domain-containing protein n=1 Tax=Sinanodonta woodiana TaxID=1069815 RepID=A0ABD3WHS3_SINWO